MRILCLDFETKDPYIALGLGAGWVYPLHVPTSQFKVLGFSTCMIETTPGLENINGFTVFDSLYSPIDPYSLSKLRKDIATSDYVLCHNATYDFGCLLALGVNITNIKVLDTKIIAHLVDNNEESFSLDYLSKKYLPSELHKQKGSLNDIVERHRLGPLKGLSEEQIAGKKTQKTYATRIGKWAITHMDELQEADFEGVSYYANHDTIATAHLLLHQLKAQNIAEENQLIRFGLEGTDRFKEAVYWSQLQKISVLMRAKGMKIDIAKLKASIPPMEMDLQRLKNTIIDQLDNKLSIKGYTKTNGVNIDSPIQLNKSLVAAGYQLPKTKNGGDSTNGKWLKSNSHDPFISLLAEYRSTKKILNDFFIKPLEFQDYCCPEARAEGATYGRLFPEFNVFGADATGRASSSCPNEQNIPKRDAKYGALCRSLFLPEDERKNWYALDYANQEGRLQVHYAALTNCTGAKGMVQNFKDTPALDLHQKVADLANITRSQAKPINLGISYGMQSGALARALGLPTKERVSQNGFKYEIAGDEAAAILKAYHAGVPFISELIRKAQDTIVNNSFIRTIDGRRLGRDIYGRDYTGVSKLIQGSAADIMYRALIAAHEAGIDIKCIIHDEFCIEGDKKDVLLMKKIMESTHPKLLVPMLVDIKVGRSWGELKEFKLSKHELEEENHVNLK